MLSERFYEYFIKLSMVSIQRIKRQVKCYSGNQGNINNHKIKTILFLIYLFIKFIL